MERKLKDEKEEMKLAGWVGMVGWSDLPSDLFSSIASRLSDPSDYARFRAVCKSWESIWRGLRPRPVFFPWLAVFPDKLDPKQDVLSFVIHASNNRIYKRPMPWHNTDLLCPYVSTNRDGWMMFVFEDGVTVINNPVTGAQLQHRLPSLLYSTPPPRLLKQHRRHQIHCVILADTLVAFAVFLLDSHHFTLATATPGDVIWSLTTVSSSHVIGGISDIVFHDADGKYYAMDYECKVMAFRLTRCCFGGGGGRKTVVGGEVSHLAETDTMKKEEEEEEDSLVGQSHLVSDGTNMLQVRERKKTKDYFEISKYCSDTDAWVRVMNMDYYLGNNSIFFDDYGARLLPLPLHQGRNCIYFTDYDDIENNQYVCHVRIYDLGKGTVESCFSTNIQLNDYRLPALMWIMPTTS